MVIESARDPKAFTDFELKGWQSSSGGYERHFARLTSQMVPATLDAAGVTRGTRLLDVCTGPGMLAGAALKRGALVTGLDFSSEMIGVARRMVPGAEFRQGDARNLPFEAGKFDAVVCGFGIIHIPEPEIALHEMGRVLKKGGRCAVSVWEGAKPANGFGILLGSIKAHGSLDVPLPHGPDFFQFSDPEKMTAALEQAGLHGIAVRKVELFWEFAEPRGLINAIFEGSVRMRALLLAQTESAQGAIMQAIEEGMGQFRGSDGAYRVPMAALVGAGVKE
jgi:SAM-dependent methyltransferase